MLLAYGSCVWSLWIPLSVYMSIEYSLLFHIQILLQPDGPIHPQHLDFIAWFIPPSLGSGETRISNWVHLGSALFNWWRLHRAEPYKGLWGWNLSSTRTYLWCLLHKEELERDTCASPLLMGASKATADPAGPGLLPYLTSTSPKHKITVNFSSRED